MLRARAASHGARRAITFLVDGEIKEAAITYGELDRRARAIAAMLLRRADPGDRVLLLHPPGLDFVAAFFGCLYAGVVAVPAYPPDPTGRQHSLARLEAVMSDSRAAIVLTTSDILAMAEYMPGSASGLKALPWLASNQIADDPLPIPRPAEPGALAFLQYTSGSTDSPKGVMILQANVKANLLAMDERLARRPGSCAVIWLPPYHDMGLMNLLYGLAVGFPVVAFSPLHFLAQPVRWLRAITRYGADFSGAPNFAYDLCVRKVKDEDLPQLDLRSWELAFNGAEPVRKDTIDRFSARFRACGFAPTAFFPCFGLAESTVAVSGSTPGRGPVFDRVDADALASGRAERIDGVDGRRSARDAVLVGCGATASLHEIVVADPVRRVAVDDGLVGEIWVRGPSIGQGYWRRPEESASVFGARRADTGEGPYLRTGDYGYLRDGELFVTGRIKDLVIIRGRNHYPQDIEFTTEASDPSIRRGCSAAFAVDVEGEERLVVVAEVTPDPSSERAPGNPVPSCARTDELVRTVRAAIAEQHGLRVDTVVLLAPRSLPKTSSGKLQRRATRDDFLARRLPEIGRREFRDGEVTPVGTRADAGEVPARAAAGGHAVEAWLQAEVARRCGVPSAEVRPDRTLTEYGLDSAALVELSASLSERLARPIPPDFLFEHSSIASVTRALERGSLIADETDFDAELALEPEIALRHPYAGHRVPSVVLVTGATGFVGAFLLDELLRQTPARFFCLVRCRDAAHGLERILDNLAEHGFAHRDLASRVAAVPADPSLPRFGLNGQDYDALARDVDTVLHCAGEPGWQKPYAALRGINVDATREALRFGCHLRTKAVHFLSTITIFEMKDGGCFENALADPRRAHGRGYNQSKAVADRLCVAAMERGLPVTVYRFPFVMGPADTGRMPLWATIPELVRGIIETGLLPIENLAINLVPVDFLARTIAALVLSPGNDRRCFHIVNRRQLGMNDVASVLTDHGYEFRQVPYDVWKSLVAQTSNPRLLPMLPLFHAYSVDALLSSFLIDPTNTYTALHERSPGLLDRMPTSAECVAGLIRDLQVRGELAPGALPRPAERVAAAQLTFPKLPASRDPSPSAGDGAVFSMRVAGPCARALASRLGATAIASELFFAAILLDALRRWTNQPEVAAGCTVARIAGPASDVRRGLVSVAASMLGGRPFRDHLGALGRTRGEHGRRFSLRAGAGSPVPVALEYVAQPERPADAAIADVVRRSLRRVAEYESSSLVCEVVAHADGWDVQWRLRAGLDVALLGHAFAYFRACVDRLCEADWHLPPSRDLLMPFAEPPGATRPRSAYRADACVHDLFLEQAARTPDRVAIHHASGDTTYRLLRDRAAVLAGRIAGLLPPGGGSQVGLYFDRSPWAIVAMLAVGMSGNSFVPLDPAYPRERLAYMLERSAAPLVLTVASLGDAAKALAPDHASVIAVDRSGEEPALAWAADAAGRPRGDGRDLMYVMFTSGSTGRPKGVMIEHRSVVNLLTSAADMLDIQRFRRLLAVSSFSFDMSIIEIFLPLISGLGVVLASSEDAQNGHRLERLIAATEPDIMNATPATWTMLLDAGWTNEPRIAVLTGGDTLGEGLKTRFGQLGCELWNCYGPTETTVYSSARKLEATEPVMIGWPVANTDLYVLDCDGERAPVGVTGELYIGGDGLARGYLGEPELTSERFVQLRPGGEAPARVFFRTGDLGRLLPGGDIDSLGRIDSQIKLRGYRIEIGEIEAAAERDELVEECVVVPQGRDEHRRLVAFVVPKPAGLERLQPLAEQAVLRGHREVWDYTYVNQVRRGGDGAAASGPAGSWIDSYTGRPLPEAEMRAFFDDIAAEVVRHGARRVLEIGCGNALLATRLCAHAEAYTGTDFSQVALDEAARALRACGCGAAALLKMDALELGDLDLETYDTVVLNSVLQYFPSAGYLDALIATIAQRTTRPLTIFVGDVRDLAQAELFYALAEFRRAEDGERLDHVFRKAQARSHHESELLLHADFFRGLPARHPRVSHVWVRSHPGHALNEMTQFRYNVTLRMNQQVRRITHWRRESWTEMPLQAQVQRAVELAEAGPFSISGIPSLRTRAARRVRDALAAAHEHARLTPELRQSLLAANGVAPEELRLAAGAAGYEFECVPCSDGRDDAIDGYFRPKGSAAVWDCAAVRGDADAVLASDPSASARAQLIADAVRGTLDRQLPAYMVPAKITIVPSLPLTPNGKVDRRSLMAQDADADALPRVPPRTAVEASVLRIWCEVLGGVPSGIRDDFFELGGNSLLAARLVRRLNDTLGARLVLQPLFTGCSTVEHISKLVEAQGGRAHES